MTKCAQMIPAATADKNGLLSNALYAMIRGGAFDSNYQGQITAAQIDTLFPPLGVYSFTPTADCSLAGKSNGLLVVMGKSVNIVQIFFERMGSWGIYYRIASDWSKWSTWRNIL